MPTETAKRMVPGAPLSPPLSKAQKKKRTGKKSDPEAPPDSPVVLSQPIDAALVDHAPGPSDVNGGAVAPELVVSDEQASTHEEDSLKVFAPILALITKRMKATGKKLTRIATYSDKAPSELNEDQLRTLKTLSTLEAVQKELEEVKKAIELLEVEHAKVLAQKQAEEERARTEMLAAALAEVEAANVARTAEVLAFLHLHSQLTRADPNVLALEIDENERSGIYSTAEVLLGPHGTAKEDVLRSLLAGEGDISGVPYSRLFDVVDRHRNSFQMEATEVVEALETNMSPVTLPSTLHPSGSLRFMQDSEIDEGGFEGGAEWIEREDVAAEVEEIVAEAIAEVAAEAAAEVAEDIVEEILTGEIPLEEAIASSAMGSSLNWADDEGGLPSIDSVHATFGTSGAATPTVHEPRVGDAPLPNETEHPGPAADEDGFTPIRGGRGSGRGRVMRGNGFRGGRGGERGGFRRGERGFRGGASRGGEFRGGDFRGGERGRGRGRSNGDFGGGWRESGERGRGGRGRGRGESGMFRGRPTGIDGEEQ